MLGVSAVEWHLQRGLGSWVRPHLGEPQYLTWWVPGQTPSQRATPELCVRGLVPGRPWHFPLCCLLEPSYPQPFLTGGPSSSSVSGSGTPCSSCHLSGAGWSWDPRLRKAPRLRFPQITCRVVPSNNTSSQPPRANCVRGILTHVALFISLRKNPENHKAKQMPSPPGVRK